MHINLDTRPLKTSLVALPPFHIARDQQHGCQCYGVVPGQAQFKKEAELPSKAIFRWDFSLLGSGVRKWSVQPRVFLMYAENLEMDNSLKRVLFIEVSGQMTSDTLWM